MHIPSAAQIMMLLPSCTAILCFLFPECPVPCQGETQRKALWSHRFFSVGDFELSPHADTEISGVCWVQFLNVCAEKSDNGKCIGGSAMHTPVRKNWSADGSLDWSDYEMVKFKSLRKLRKTSSRLKIPEFSRTDFDLFKWKVLMPLAGSS